MEWTLVVIGLLATAGLLGATVLIALVFRRVVPTNEVHIVQSAKKTTSYGKDSGHGNTYYEWPSFLPLLGVTKTKLPVSVFDVDLQGYEAYDKGRLPFVADVKAFFRITNSDVAAQRALSFEELHNQLRAIVQGAVRVVLASNDIETILQGRSEFGVQFTKEVAEQLINWGVSTVKNIELMDIRDHKESNVIKNIMEKKKSHIEMESRTEVAKNKRLAQVAEIEAQKEVDLQKQEAQQSVGLRTVTADREVELQRQNALQTIKEQQRLTKEKEMNVVQVEQERNAKIVKEVGVIQAQQQKETAILNAEGQLETKKREAEGISAEGLARANAEKAMQLAPVEAQITLAKEIGENASYQKYLTTIRELEANQAVGIAQAQALTEADIKIIANNGNATTGLKSAMDIFSSKGGTEVGAFLEGLAQSTEGKSLLDTFSGAKAATKKPVSNGNGAAKEF